MKAKRLIGITLLWIALMVFILHWYFKSTYNSFLFDLLPLFSIICSIIGVILVIPGGIIFDNEEWTPNRTSKQLVEKIRFRALLFNNLSVGLFFAALLVIVAGFYFLIRSNNTPGGAINSEHVDITIRVAASALVVFLVQVLFRVFKYLLRVAAFYNAKADAIEFKEIKPELSLENLSAIFTPDNYDISDLPQSSANGILKK